MAGRHALSGVNPYTRRVGGPRLRSRATTSPRDRFSYTGRHRVTGLVGVGQSPRVWPRGLGLGALIPGVQRPRPARHTGARLPTWLDIFGSR